MIGADSTMAGVTDPARRRAIREDQIGIMEHEIAGLQRSGGAL
jgi:hypothetical protein